MNHPRKSDVRVPVCIQWVDMERWIVMETSRQTHSVFNEIIQKRNWNERLLQYLSEPSPICRRDYFVAGWDAMCAKAVNLMLRAFASGACMDEHLADQLMVFMVLASGGCCDVNNNIAYPSCDVLVPDAAAFTSEHLSSCATVSWVTNWSYEIGQFQAVPINIAPLRPASSFIPFSVILTNSRLFDEYLDFRVIWRSCEPYF
jgi:uncharacterized protein (DUF779 family)